MNRTEAFKNVVKFHQHACPGAAFGLRVAEAALDRLGVEAPTSTLVLVSETDACAVDALQVLTGCTFGKRNLIHEDTGRNVFTVWRRGDTEGVRLRARPGSLVFRSPELWALAGLIEQGTATLEDEAKFAAAQSDRIARLLEAPEHEILLIDTVETPSPTPKALAPVDTCQKCGEPTSVETLHDHRGQMLCPACHLNAHGGQLPADHAGHGHHPASSKHVHDHGHSHDAGHAHQH